MLIYYGLRDSLTLFATAECNFEENHLCGFMNRWNPNVNWFVGGGNIGNSQSILPRDHTINNEFGKYGKNEKYLERDRKKIHKCKP